MDSIPVSLEEMHFVLRELADIERVLQTPNVESLADTELTDAILSQARHFAQTVLLPLDSV